MPSAPPSSEVVSAMADAAPARSGGAAPGGAGGPRAIRPAGAGSGHSPASSGDSPSTSWRYWAVKSRAPKDTKKSRVLVARAALKARLANSDRSSSGSASRRWRATNASPTPRPATIDSPWRQQQDHHRHGDQEHRAPPEALQQQPAEQRPDGGAGREAGHPDADGHPALARVEEHVADQRQGRGGQGGPGHPEQGAGGDQHLGS